MTETVASGQPITVADRGAGLTRVRRIHVVLTLLLLLVASLAFYGQQLITRWHLMSARAAVASGRPEIAEDAARRALSIQPDDVSAVLLVSRSLQLQGRVQEAYQFLQFARQRRGAVDAIQIEEALCAARVGTIGSAMNSLQRFLTRSGVDDRTVFDACVSGYCTFGRFDEAESILTRWELRWPRDFRCLAYRGRCSSRTKALRRSSGLLPSRHRCRRFQRSNVAALRRVLPGNPRTDTRPEPDSAHSLRQPERCCRVAADGSFREAAGRRDAGSRVPCELPQKQPGIL